MTSRSRGILLTGATGLLGRYLLRDFLLSGFRVTVLVRDARSANAPERIGAIVDFWNDALGRKLPEPTVLTGDLRAEDLGLTASDRRWLAVSCDAVVHAAASLAFQSSADGEPWATNLQGTKHLLQQCQRLGIKEIHHVSTAFVCGEAASPIFEDDLRGSQSFHNPYEESKFKAEQLLRDAVDCSTTIYRPSVIVGDRRTGYTSAYHGLYRFMEFAALLADRARQLPMRLPLSGSETKNLVTVDWVADAIVRLVNRPEQHGRTYHLVSAQPVPVRTIKETAEQVLKLNGVSFAGPEVFSDGTPLERLFLERLQEYWPYLNGDPIFDFRNLKTALPDLPSVPIDSELLARLIEFAVEHRWGRGPQRSADAGRLRSEIDCREYVEEIFPANARRSPIARQARLHVQVGLDIRGPAGGQWTLQWIEGELADVRAGISPVTDVLYRLDQAVLDDVVRGRQNSAEAFFARRIEVEGDVEKALKLAVLFDHFLAESPERHLKGVANAVQS